MTHASRGTHKSNHTARLQHLFWRAGSVCGNTNNGITLTYFTCIRVFAFFFFWRHKAQVFFQFWTDFYIGLTAPQLVPGTHLANHPQGLSRAVQRNSLGCALCTVTLASRWRHLIGPPAASRLKWKVDNMTTVGMLIGIDHSCMNSQATMRCFLKKDKNHHQLNVNKKTTAASDFFPVVEKPHTHLREYLECLTWKGSIGFTNVSCKSIREATHQISTPCTEHRSIR